MRNSGGSDSGKEIRFDKSGINVFGKLKKMEINEIKKCLYREKPKAKFMEAKREGIYYETEIKSGHIALFKIPLSDLGDAKFYPEMESQLLIRWLLM